MDYIKIPVICLDAIRMLRDAERGRLFLAVLEYREGRELSLDGAEQYVFAILKAQMDKDMEISRKRAEAGRTGGSKSKQTLANEANVSKCKQPPSPLPSPPTPPVSISPSPKEKPPKGGKKKVPPSVDEVRSYCLERKNGIDPEAFVDYYEARGWKYGQGKPVVDWKAAVRTWERRRGKEKQESDGEKIGYFRAPSLPPVGN